MKADKIFFVLLLILLGVVVTFLFLRNEKKASSSVLQTGEKQTATVSLSTSSVSRGYTPDIPLSLPKEFTIHVFADELGKPRDLVFSPKGTLLVSIPADGLVVALPDANADGVADSKKIVIGDLNHPHGLAFYNGKLFVATTTEVIRYDWNDETTTAVEEKVLFSLPQNRNHNNRTITFDEKGNIYVSVGSTCNVCNELDDRSATIMISNSNGDNPQVFAKGLRNAPFSAINPQTKELWATEMGRDHLGDDLPPDEINIIREGQDYGWPICFGNKRHDTDFDKRLFATTPCEETEAPIFEIPAHSAPLGLVFINSSQFPLEWQNDLLVAYHGSWNRTKPAGYKVVRLHVNGNTITESSDFLTGFIPTDAVSGSDAKGRPVDLVFDEKGNLFLSDDKAGVIYIIEKTN